MNSKEDSSALPVAVTSVSSKYVSFALPQRPSPVNSLTQLAQPAFYHHNAVDIRVEVIATWIFRMVTELASVESELGISITGPQVDALHVKVLIVDHEPDRTAVLRRGGSEVHVYKVSCIYGEVLGGRPKVVILSSRRSITEGEDSMIGELEVKRNVNDRRSGLVVFLPGREDVVSGL